MNDYLAGTIGAIAAAFTFGSQFVPLKGQDLSDGLFVTWLKVAGGLLTGCVLTAIRGFPPFQPYAALGGLIWSSSQTCIVPIMGVTGVVGLVITGSVKIVFGWATARFGWFGLIPPEVSHKRMIVEYIGLTLVVISAVIMALIGRSKARRQKNETLKRGLGITAGFDYNMATISAGFVDGFIPFEAPMILQTESNESDPGNDEPSDAQPETRRQFALRLFRLYRAKVAACVLAVLAAFAAAQGMTPVTYAQQHNVMNTTNGLDYGFSFASGAFFGGTFYFLVYCVLMRNRPKLSASVALPGILYGVLWAAGMFCIFFANGKLTQSIAYPICNRGRRNLILLLVGVIVSLAGVTLVGLADVV